MRSTLKWARAYTQRHEGVHGGRGGVHARYRSERAGLPTNTDDALLSALNQYLRSCLVHVDERYSFSLRHPTIGCRDRVDTGGQVALYLHHTPTLDYTREPGLQASAMRAMRAMRSSRQQRLSPSDHRHRSDRLYGFGAWLSSPRSSFSLHVQAPAPRVYGRLAPSTLPCLRSLILNSVMHVAGTATSSTHGSSALSKAAPTRLTHRRPAHLGRHARRTASGQAVGVSNNSKTFRPSS